MTTDVDLDGPASEQAVDSGRCPRYPFPVEEYELGDQLRTFQRTPGLHQVEMPYGGRAYLAVREADVRQVLTDRRFSRQLANAPAVPRLQDEQLPDGSLSALDGADHLRLRRLITAAFTARTVRRYADETDRAARELIARMTAAGQPGEIVSSVCAALPTHMICEILGVPADERAPFRTMLKGLRNWRRPASEAQAARSVVEEYFVGLIERRRAEPGEDLLSDLLRAQEADGALDDVELLNLAVALLGGGVGTPKVFFSGLVYLVLTHREAYERIAADPAQADPVMEEVLRYVPVGTGGGKMRVASEDVEVGGTLVRAGEAVLPGMGAANRDPGVHASADELAWDRGATRHLAFGAGAHRCLGAELARLQGRTLLVTLTELLPGLRLADGPASVQWLDGDVTRGPASISVRW